MTLLIEKGKDPFEGYHDELVNLRKAGHLGQAKACEMLRKIIRGVPYPSSSNEAQEMFEEFAKAANTLNYIDALYRIEHQQFFDILIDFKMPNIFKLEAFQTLRQYFEFHPTAPQMRLLVPISEIPSEIWHLFRAAQRQQLKDNQKGHLFDLDQLDIDHPPEDQLYALSIQMFGHLENRAVDMAYLSPKGTYKWAERFGVFLLPGGGMVEINAKVVKQKLEKTVDEHFEEQHANLWHKAAKDYDSVDEIQITHCLNELIAQAPENIRANLKQAMIRLPDTCNHHYIEELIVLIDDAIAPIEAKHKTLKQRLTQADQTLKNELNLCSQELTQLHTLRASVQLEPLKLTPIYQKVLDFVSEHSIIVPVEQYVDTRACGGKQISDCALMFSDLEQYLQDYYGGIGCEPGDDIRNAGFKHMTLLETLAQYQKVKFSHLLITTVHQIYALQQGKIDYEKVCNREQFEHARKALMDGAQTLAEKINPHQKAVIKYGIVAAPPAEEKDQNRNISSIGGLKK